MTVPSAAHQTDFLLSTAGCELTYHTVHPNCKLPMTYKATTEGCLSLVIAERVRHTRPALVRGVSCTSKLHACYATAPNSWGYTDGLLLMACTCMHTRLGIFQIFAGLFSCFIQSRLEQLAPAVAR